MVANSALNCALTTADVGILGVKIPVALRFREGATKLTIFYNGAVDRKRSASGRVFQRSTWAAEVNSHCLFICDPALLMGKKLSIGWGQVDRQRWAGNLYPVIAEQVGDALGIPASRRLHFGSSAGGYQALVAAAADRGSHALVNNPQTDWSAYWLKPVVTSARRRAFGSSNAAAVAQAPQRARVWEWFKQLRHVPSFRFLLNVASHNDVSIMHAPLVAALTTMPTDVEMSECDVTMYRDEQAGHNPLPKEPLVEHINAYLADLAQP